ncbi:FAD-dependent monooxygenase [Alterisphingorhabdus coralli]|uniref:FAD-dependent monooxygenase n=1 Tax=Alterisphingorhabdus coralli TaxID=3071408 RepID=A0AA97FAV4_9SPHN|nr:FAD-dependent monooxygenase [Parasphingorhabdus sp. SCSIO 66989]WOE75700.1 FAD-dependent monooxygenase [Parasphingorhabdus sp. SCSIO 66989]
MTGKAIIAGGGIGGLTAALCLHHFGWDACVCEQAEAIAEVGAGIQISPNGMKVLRALGLDEAVLAAGFRPKAAEFRGGTSGRLIFRESMAGYEAKYGAPYVHIHRADLIAILQQAVEERMPGAIHTHRQVTGYGQGADSAWLTLADGPQISGDVVIGADGIHSAIRTQMLGAEKPRFTGNIAWRAVVPVEKLGLHVPDPVAGVWFGEGKHAVTYLLRGGKLANFVGVVERDERQSESWTEQGTREQVLADFADWHPIVTTLIEQAEAHYRWALFDRKPLSQWVDGRVVLLGDACHPMLPFMAQGAVQAMEDGYVLARLLAESDSVSDALTGYFAKRHDRTSRVQMAARRNGDLFHQRTPLGKLTTHGPMMAANRLKLDVADRRLAWLYGHDVTA